MSRTRKKIGTNLVLLVALTFFKVDLSSADPRSELCQHYLEELEETKNSSSSRSARMWNGHEASPHQFPFLVLVDDKCSGAIIGPFQILTTADCVLDYFKPKKGFPLKPLSKMRVMKSEHDRTMQDGEVQVAIANLMAHEHYKDEGDKGKTNNIALLETREPLFVPDEAKGHARPIAIDCKPVADNQLLQVAGWGSTYPNDNELSRVPLWHVVRKVPDDICECFLSKYDMDVTSGSLCASFESGSGTICNGDSSDPLFKVAQNGESRLVGLASYYKLPCVHGKVPAVYTNLADHIQWILENQTK